jgi:general secretion pathway protein G
MTMHVPRIKRPARQGFTLIEMMMVLLIVAILAALTAAGVLKFLKLGPSASNKAQIGQLEASVAEFHRSFQLGKEYFPSQLILCQYSDDYGASQLEQDSMAFLLRMFPKTSSTWSKAAGGAGINWIGYVTNASGTTVAATWPAAGANGGKATLEGDQCLVFFLGGIPLTDQTTNPATLSCLGFSTNSTNPADSSIVSPSGRRKGPFYEFDSSRLVNLPHSSSGTGFWSFKDVYGVYPYLYFSSYRMRNGYNRYATTDCPSPPLWPHPLGVPASPAVSPYLTSGSNYVYPSKFQIISAGADLTFGAGGVVWNPDAASPDVQSRDDQSNFSDTLLFVN